MLDQDKRIGAIVVLKDGELVTYKASVSLVKSSVTGLADRYFGPHKQEDCEIKYAEFRGITSSAAWTQAGKWIASFPVSEWAKERD